MAQQNTLPTKTVIGYMNDATIKQEAILRDMSLSPEAIQRVLTNALVKNPAIARCTRDSIYEAVYECCQMGIVPDGRHGAVVPVRNNNKGIVEAKFWPMVWGYATNARRAIPGLVLHNRIAYKDDEFECTLGTSPRIHHVENPQGDKSDQNVYAFYAVAFMPGNPVAEFEVMYMPEIMAMRKDNAGPWSTNFRAMAMVRPLKRLLKRLPVSGQFAMQMATDSTADPDGPSLYDVPEGGQVIDQDGAPVTMEDMQPRAQQGQTRAQQTRPQAQQRTQQTPPQAQQAQVRAEPPAPDDGTIEGEDLGSLDMGGQEQSGQQQSQGQERPIF